MPDLERHSVGIGQRPALLVVDVIRGFTDPACPLGSEADAVVGVIRKLLDAFRAQALPIYFTTVVYRDDAQASVFRRRLPALNVLTPGSAWIEPDPRLERRDDEDLVEKQWASAFFKTDLDRRLAGSGADSLVVTGLTTSGCVRATAVDGLQHDYPVFVPEDGTGDRNSEAHRANLFDLQAKYADVVKADQIIRWVTQHDARVRAS